MRWDEVIKPSHGGGRGGANPGIRIRRREEDTGGSGRRFMYTFALSPAVARRGNFTKGDIVDILFSREDMAVGMRRTNSGIGYRLQANVNKGQSPDGKQKYVKVAEENLPLDLRQMLLSRLDDAGNWETDRVNVADATAYVVLNRPQEQPVVV